MKRITTAFFFLFLIVSSLSAQTINLLTLRLDDKKSWHERIYDSFTERRMLFLYTQIGFFGYAYFNAHEDAFTFRNENQIIREPATAQKWHRNKNLALLSFGTAVGSIWLSKDRKYISTKRAVFRFISSALMADAVWHRFYYKAKWGEQFPKNENAYDNRITIPLFNQDIIHGVDKNWNKIIDHSEIALWFIWNIAFDPIVPGNLLGE